MKPWTVLTIVVAAILFGLALSNAFYEATSPWEFPWHVALRKTYSVAAFTVVGLLLRRALPEHGRRESFPICIWALAAYSGSIEVGQDLVGSKEGLFWNAIDVACGALGGWIACFDRSFLAIRTAFKKD